MLYRKYNIKYNSYFLCNMWLHLPAKMVHWKRLEKTEGEEEDRIEI